MSDSPYFTQAVKIMVNRGDYEDAKLIASVRLMGSNNC